MSCCSARPGPKTVGAGGEERPPGRNLPLAAVTQVVEPHIAEEVLAAASHERLQAH